MEAMVPPETVSLIRPNSSEIKDFEDFLSGKSLEAAETPMIEATPEENPTVETPIIDPHGDEPEADDLPPPEEAIQPRRKKRAIRKLRSIPTSTNPEHVVEPEPDTNPTPARGSLLDLAVDDRKRLLRVKKLKTKVTPLTTEDLRVPSSLINPPFVPPIEIQVSDSDEQIEIVSALSRKRKHPSDSHPSAASAPSPPCNPTPVRSPSPKNIYMDPSPTRDQNMPSPPRPSTHKFQNDAMGSPTLWPRFNANFPFHLFEAFVRETDDHRFGNSTIGDLVDEGISYLAKANAIFGCLRPRHVNAEAEEEAMRNENNMLKSTLAREKIQHDSVLHTNEGLRKELAQAKEDLKVSNDELKSTKEELKATRASQQDMTTMNADLVEKNEVLKTKNEELITANRSLAMQIDEVQTKAQDDKEAHLDKRRKLHDKLKALKELVPPLTDDLRKQIQEEYRKSDELNTEILKVYSEGYDVCRGRDKEKLIAAQLDPALLDSKDEGGA